jgi:hypothetical protein
MCKHLRQVAKWVDKSPFEEVNDLADKIDFDGPTVTDVPTVTVGTIELDSDTNSDSISDLPPPPPKSQQQAEAEDPADTDDDSLDFDKLVKDIPAVSDVPIQGHPHPLHAKPFFFGGLVGVGVAVGGWMCGYVGSVFM